MLFRHKRQSSAPIQVGSAGLIVGSEIETSCTKCKSITAHVVVAKVGAVPTRVECRRCSTVHAYRTPRRPAGVKGAPIEERSVELVWQDAMKRARGAVVPYSAGSYYEVGARLSHLSFGEGVVSRLPSTTVCEVIFETGSVKLLMGRVRPS
jgi:hypothetical protein